MRKLRILCLALAAAAPLALGAPAGALGAPAGDVPLPEAGSEVLPPAGGEPSAALVQVVTDVVAIVGVPLPVPPGGAPLQPVVDALPPDVCTELTGPLTEAGGPVAASCTVRPTDNGGVDVEICLTVATIATCDDPSSPSPSPTTTPTTTPTVTPGSGGAGNGAGSGNGSGAARSSTSGTSGARTDDGRVGTASATLPFTGGSVGALLALGTALATSGGLATRAVRRHRG